MPNPLVVDSESQNSMANSACDNSTFTDWPLSLEPVPSLLQLFNSDGMNNSSQQIQSNPSPPKATQTNRKSMDKIGNNKISKFTSIINFSPNSTLMQAAIPDLQYINLTDNFGMDFEKPGISFKEYKSLFPPRNTRNYIDYCRQLNFKTLIFIEFLKYLEEFLENDEFFTFYKFSKLSFQHGKGFLAKLFRIEGTGLCIEHMAKHFRANKSEFLSMLKSSKLSHLQLSADLMDV